MKRPPEKLGKLYLLLTPAIIYDERVRGKPASGFPGDKSTGNKSG
jgi:hypothetical protein